MSEQLPPNTCKEDKKISTPQQAQQTRQSYYAPNTYPVAGQPSYYYPPQYYQYYGYGASQPFYAPQTPTTNATSVPAYLYSYPGYYPTNQYAIPSTPSPNPFIGREWWKPQSSVSSYQPPQSHQTNQYSNFQIPISSNRPPQTSVTQPKPLEYRGYSGFSFKPQPRTNIIENKNVFVPIKEQAVSKQQQQTYGYMPNNIIKSQSKTLPTNNETSTKTKKEEDIFSTSLKEYVKRSFDACTSSDEKDALQDVVRNFLRDTIKNKTNLQEWNSVPLLVPLLVNENVQRNNRKDDSIKGQRKKKKKKLNKSIQPLYDPDQEKKKTNRHVRFSEDCNILKRETSIQELNDDCDFIAADSKVFIIGTSNALEKQYLRLTSAPDPSTVRPEKQLHKSFDYVYSIWNQKRDYHFVCEQLKSIRQDLTIQGIRNEFTVRVYETHGRISIQMSDRDEFNQCQTCLKHLYKDGIIGNQTEFLVYNILYDIYTKNHYDISNLLIELNEDQMSDPEISKALHLYYSFSSNDYLRFFQLYNTINLNCSKALVDLFIDKVRLSAFTSVIHSYLPSVTKTLLKQHLNFSNPLELDEWLKSHSITNVDDETLDCRSIRLQLENIQIS